MFNSVQSGNASQLRLLAWSWFQTIGWAGFASYVLLKDNLLPIFIFVVAENERSWIEWMVALLATERSIIDDKITSMKGLRIDLTYALNRVVSYPALIWKKMGNSLLNFIAFYRQTKAYYVQLQWIQIDFMVSAK